MENIEALLAAMAAQSQQNQAQAQLNQRQADQMADMMAQNQALMQLIAQREIPAAVAPRVSLHKDLSGRMEKFSYNAEENSTFELWYSRYETIFTGEAAAMSDAQKVDLLTEKLSYQDYIKFANTILPLTKANITFADAIKELKRLFGRKESQFALRYKCLKIEMESGEDFDTYGARINLKCEKFDIAQCTADDFKVLMFIQGITKSQHATTLEKLLLKLDETEKKREAADDPDTIPKLRLQDVINIATQLGALKLDKSMVMSPSSPTSEVMAIQKNSWSKPRADENSRKTQQTDNASKPSKPPRPCSFCGGEHFHRDCSFRTLECGTCTIVGHKAGFCKQAATERERLARSYRRSPRRQSLQLKAAEKSTRKYVEPDIDDTKLKLQLDSGSDWTIISEANYRKIRSPKLTPCEEQAISASGDPVPLLGKFKCRIKLHGRENVGDCYVAKSKLNVLGSDWMEALDLWSVPIASVCNKIDSKSSSLPSEIKAKFPRLFEAKLGLCNKTKASLTLKPGSKPIFRKARPVPFAATAPIEAELKRLQLMNVISPIEYSDYAAPIVVVKKSDGRIRICADYSTGLNDSLEPNKYPLPTPEDINSKLAEFKYFSKIDLSDAFLQIELDDDAKKLMAINTHCGMFQVNRLQPGIKTAPGFFQQLVETMMCGAPGTFPYIDDFIIGGRTKEEHRENLFGALKRIEDYGFHLRIDKCSFEQESITFLGLRIDKDGSQPDPDKIATLQLIPAPSNVQQLQSFLGAVTWYGKFIDGIKELRGPLDELLCKDNKFNWQPKHQQSFEALKNILSSDLALTHYDPTKPIIVAADASSYGMGAVILHKMPDGSERPIMHAASSLSKAEKNYPQVQREALALVFALKKFHRYIYGRKFELRTDHKPLLSIFGSKEGIPVYTASRLQRYALILLAYDFTIKYIDTKSFAYADFISRLIETHERPDEDIVIATTVAGSLANVKNENAPTVNVKKQNHAPKVNVKNKKDALRDSNAPCEANTSDVAIARIRLEDAKSTCYALDTAHTLPVTFDAIQKETFADDVLQKVLKLCNDGWPCTQKSLQPDVAAFFIQRNNLTIIEKCLFVGHRIVIPECFRNAILSELHQGHPGIARMKLLARSKVYWPSIDKNIEDVVRSCDNCATIAKSPIKCSLQAWPTPNAPWKRIHIDFAGPVDGFNYLVVVDAFSNWPEVFKMTSTTTAKTIDRLEEAFSRHGLVDTIVSDNGPQFVSDEFKKYCAANGIAHIKTAPYHPQSNGRAERFVELLKTGLKKLSGEGKNVEQDLRKFLLCYRFTPSYALGEKSPFQVMTGRVMKTKLDLLHPNKQRSADRNHAMEQQFNNHHGAKWKDFDIDDKVFIKLYSNNKWNWVPGVVVGKYGVVNYSVLANTPSGERLIKIHANQMKKRFNIINDTDDNLLLEDFELEMPAAIEIQPNDAIEPIEDEDSDDFADAQEEVDVVSENDEDVIVQEPLRRSARANAGKLPQKFADYKMN